MDIGLQIFIAVYAVIIVGLIVAGVVWTRAQRPGRQRRSKPFPDP
jgi:hypothetical protein